MKEKRNNITMKLESQHKTKGDMAKSVDATDLIGLGLGMETR